MANVKAGDLAVVAVSVTGANVGKLVRVIRHFANAGETKELNGRWFRSVYNNTMLIESLGSPIVYLDGYKAKIGPCPASFLRPIRGNETPGSTETTMEMEKEAAR